MGKVIAAHAVVFLEVADDGFDGAGKLLVVLRQVRPVAAPGVLGPLAVLFRRHQLIVPNPPRGPPEPRSVGAYPHDDFPDRPLANGRNSLQQRRITSWGLEKYLEI